MLLSNKDRRKSFSVKPGISWPNIIRMFINILSVLYECKVEILAGVFSALAIFSHFYNRGKIKKEIKGLKKEAIIFENICINLIGKAMSETEKYSLKEMIGEMSRDFKVFKSEMRDDINQLIKTFNDYKLSNNERVSKLEGHQKMTWKTISIYVGFISAFVMMAINTYMALK